MMELDFSRFHATDHWPGTRYCRSQYGGVRIHLSYWWAYRGRSYLNTFTRCLVGHHHQVPYWTRQPDDPPGFDRSRPPTGWCCGDCGVRLSPPRRS